MDISLSHRELIDDDELFLEVLIGVEKLEFFGQFSK